MGSTLVEKILVAHTDAPTVSPGEVVMVRCDVVMTNDISGPMAFRAMGRMGADRVFDPEKVVIVPDHFVPAKDERSAALQKLLRDWAYDQFARRRYAWFGRRDQCLVPTPDLRDRFLP